VVIRPPVIRHYTARRGSDKTAGIVRSARYSDFRTSSSSFATLAAIRRASSTPHVWWRVNSSGSFATFAAIRRASLRVKGAAHYFLAEQLRAAFATVIGAPSRYGRAIILASSPPTISDTR